MNTVIAMLIFTAGVIIFSMVIAAFIKDFRDECEDARLARLHDKEFNDWMKTRFTPERVKAIKTKWKRNMLNDAVLKHLEPVDPHKDCA